MQGLYPMFLRFQQNLKESIGMSVTPRVSMLADCNSKGIDLLKSLYALMLKTGMFDALCWGCLAFQSFSARFCYK
jgi:hypothetical protein